MITTFPHSQCTCTQETSGGTVCSAEVKIATLSPRVAIEMASREPPTSCFTKALADLCLSDSRYRHAGAGDMFVTKIYVGKPQKRLKHPYWELPIYGLARIMRGIWDVMNEGDVRNDRILLELLQHLHKIIPLLRNDLDYLNSQGSNADGLRTSVAAFLTTFADGDNIKRYISCVLYLHSLLMYRHLGHCTMTTRSS